MSDDRRFELPDDLTPDEERAIIRALERYVAQESPHPHAWVLAGRIDATGLGALQARQHRSGESAPASATADVTRPTQIMSAIAEEGGASEA